MIAESTMTRSPGTLLPDRPTAVLPLGTQQVPGLLLIRTIARRFAGAFPQVLLHHVAVIDYDVLDSRMVNYDIGREIERLRAERSAELERFAALARDLGLAADTRVSVGTDPLRESAAFCEEAARRYPHAACVLGTIVSARTSWTRWLFRDRSAEALRRRLERRGIPVVVLPLLAPDPERGEASSRP